MQGAVLNADTTPIDFYFGCESRPRLLPPLLLTGVLEEVLVQYAEGTRSMFAAGIVNQAFEVLRSWYIRMSVYLLSRT